MTKQTITIEVDDARLEGYTDDFLAQAWHALQWSPVAFGDREICRLVEKLGREIIRRWLGTVPPALWNVQGVHHYQAQRLPKFAPAQAAKCPEGECEYAAAEFRSNCLYFCTKCHHEMSGRTFADLTPISAEELDEIHKVNDAQGGRS